MAKGALEMRRVVGILVAVGILVGVAIALPIGLAAPAGAVGPQSASEAGTFMFSPPLPVSGDPTTVVSNLSYTATISGCREYRGASEAIRG
jgi:hypothetical protein